MVRKGVRAIKRARVGQSLWKGSKKGGRGKCGSSRTNIKEKQKGRKEEEIRGRTLGKLGRNVQKGLGKRGERSQKKEKVFIVQK